LVSSFLFLLFLSSLFPEEGGRMEGGRGAETRIDFPEEGETREEEVLRRGS